MIRVDDRLTLAPGVRLTPDGLHDEVRGTSSPLNETGRLVLSLARAATLAEVARALAARYGIDATRAREDVLAYCGSLNARLLLNVRRTLRSRLHSWFVALLLLATRGLVPVPLTRRLVSFRSGGVRSAVRTVLSLTPRVTPAALAGGAALGALFAALGDRGLHVAVAGAAALACAVVLHEAGHVLALRGVPCCVVARGLDAFVVHRAVSPAHRAVVAVTGPAAATAVGWIVCFAATAVPTPSLPVAALVLLAQPLALTVAGGDGRVACGLS